VTYLGLPFRRNDRFSGFAQQGDEIAPCPEKRTEYVVVGALPQPPHIRIPLRNQGSFIPLLAGLGGNGIEAEPPISTLF
jgi:hypothetical protein